ncbi:hypothetical protein PR048_004298 [Dryococelus australis]|uniref:DDE Tnp4 domain-containing protein n=1 Tax=Dryococelus australis TaxID=614101 RepID=A0ABQ9I625_9NEOP|nr:hypothetical protein PR048_004298 [Dryococelus australis]
MELEHASGDSGCSTRSNRLKWGRGKHVESNTGALYIFQLPKTPLARKEISKTFEIDWNLPHCVGALDGKHVLLQALVNSGSDFYNYKSNFNIVIFALTWDAKDGYQMAAFFKTVSHIICFPRTGWVCLYQKNFLNTVRFLYFKNIMKPCLRIIQRIFNYRSSRTRLVVENTFGVVFRVLRKPMLLEPPKAELIVMTIIILHNYLRNHSPTLYMPHGSLDQEENGVLIEGLWRSEVNVASMIPLRNIPRTTPAVYHKIRDEVADYCMKEEAISWQNTYA